MSIEVKTQLISEGTDSVSLDIESVNQYHHELVDSQAYRLREIATVISSNVDLYPLAAEFAVLIAGSDGKLECAPICCEVLIKPIEFILVATSNAIAAEAKEILAATAACPHELPFDDIEVKSLESDLPLSGYFGNLRHAWPDRILSAQFVFGSPEVRDQAVFRIHHEWESQRKIRESVKNNLKVFLKTCDSGFHDQQQFNRATGEIYFEPTQFILGLKYGPIRSIQVFLTLSQLTNRFGAELPLNTSEKLEMTFPHDRDVLEAYQIALRIYHWQKEQYVKNRDPNITLDSSELDQIVDTIVAFIQKNKSK